MRVMMRVLRFLWLTQSPKHQPDFFFLDPAEDDEQGGGGGGGGAAGGGGSFQRAASAGPDDGRRGGGMVSVEAYSSREVSILYTPRSLGKTERGSITFANAVCGTWIYNLAGEGLPPAGAAGNKLSETQHEK